MQNLDEILQEAQASISTLADMAALDQYRVLYLGKKGKLTEFLKTLGKLPLEERPLAGQKINTVKEAIQVLIDQRSHELKKILADRQAASEAIDVTLPGRGQSFGSLHPITLTCLHLKKIFTRMGFMFRDGPEIEDDYHNFTALNVGPNHPARAMQDTFYLESSDKLLRTQMSPVQIRTMLDTTVDLPLRMVAIGRVYRRDFDLTHTPMFHQMECLMVDKGLSFTHLKGLMKQFLSEFFEADVSMRFRPSYFPFTEPSAEVDMKCLNCSGQGCRICKNTGWLEVLGCGMVHPKVLQYVKIDSSIYRGFACGVGIDRLTLLKYGISDLRSLFENDLRFLKQF